LHGANLSGIDLRDANLRAADLGSAYLGGANLSGLDLSGANLRGADLTDANLNATNLSSANLREATIKGANLAKAALTRANLSGVDISGAGLKSADFSEANLNGVNLSGVDFSEAIFSRVDFTGVDLRKAILRKANLEGANLSEVNLFGKNLSDADLREADLRKANLGEANLNRAHLERSDLTGALIYRAIHHEWRIEGVKCDFIFCDPAGEIPFPKNRNFRPGEFERLFRHLPTLELVLEAGATGLDAFALDQVVQTLNEKRPERELKLEGFHSGGQPQAAFTVLRKEYCDEQLRAEIATGYQVQMAAWRRSPAAPRSDRSSRSGAPELRKSRRYERLETVLVEKPESEPLGPAQLNNFSAEGLMLKSGFAIAPGELIKIRFEKPLIASSSNVMTSKVVWCRDLAAHDEAVSRFGIGVTLVP